LRNAYLDQRYAARHGDVKAGQYVLIAVTDTGLGMTGEQVERAFEPFYTTKPEGAGLGLSQVYGFIKQSEGHVKIYSERGQGTTVKIYLPRRVQDALADEEDHKAVDVIEGLPGETILVVEDDEDVRTYLVETLRDLN